MNGAKLRARLQAGEAITMFTPHHSSSGMAARLVELGADSVFLDCEHGTWSFEDVRETAQIVRSVNGAAIVRPHSHERPLIIRYLNAGADGIMVPMVDTAQQAQAIVDTVRYAIPADYQKRLVISMVETVKAVDNLEEMLAVEGIDVFFIGPGDLSQDMGFPPAPPFGEPRPAVVMDKVAVAVEKIRAAGKIAGTLATSDELPHWLEKGVQFFYMHSDPFLRIGMNGVKKTLSR
ncbi:HpcH/HpaI aldolase family protein [Agrobacterium rosae]|uniref:2,4-dihydroxyhept-2-ene-1,7-dioic acid aldolase n=1 Tax=Agrobacterium rosae TaxID=1972867 RepID=A0AAE5RST9_9HYPH|nr:aldolase/citrate lyase family protein [Agrobacterium rosae]KAA3507518.1 2,4-dihydroxyhept-2-ene-1,7-dioic acid aldolase [Agrobacterium rosae]KAA3511958.1 2,4-dihydroxyhept-2-ene-1,7-dioic acid aldolase [Agrobacterium rosae]MCM2435520.1 2,4-dihydroxyhept-2-ene-1,7-dioic acid aldolase [Agrobacterium rosae]MQB51322.1 2,4-dihydroxyhept-2-ene-1,7-dioic acid aldolase [Agrobacterium rosae]POO48549.1 2,4-dihydroxyhept-2-ene-1,7-dioic acid aldolase [Agrobacterium rosae]